MEEWLRWMRQKLLSAESERSDEPRRHGPRKRPPFEQSEYMEEWLSG